MTVAKGCRRERSLKSTRVCVTAVRTTRIGRGGLLVVGVVDVLVANFASKSEKLNELSELIATAAWKPSSSTSPKTQSPVSEASASKFTYSRFHPRKNCVYPFLGYQSSPE
jgi:hypothetical protein